MEVGKETKEEMDKKRRREEEKEENETESVKRRCVGPLISSVKKEIGRVVVVFLGGPFWRSLRTCLIVSLRLGWMCLWCLM